MPAKRKTSPESSPPNPITAPAFPLECQGLREDNPRDFLAALGLLRLLDLLYPDKGMSFAWTDNGHPIYHAAVPPEDTWADELVNELRRFNAQEPHPFVHHKVIKVPRATFRAAIRSALERREGTDAFARLPALLYAAFGSQTHDMEKEEISPTDFSFSNGQGGKELLRDICEMIEKDLTAEGIVGGLAGNPSSLRDAKSFRWHPAEFRAAAYRAADPGSGVKGDIFMDYPSANILAFFGLSFYPVVDRTDTWETSGFSEHREFGTTEGHFSWPVWTTPLRADPLTTLLHLPEIHGTSISAAALRLYGCLRTWRSRRFNSDKSLYFAPAGRVF